MRTLAKAILLAGLACTLGGRPTMAGPDAPAPPTANRCKIQRWADPWPTLDRPADPWFAVAGGKPVRVSVPTDRRGNGAPANAPCDAAHDHCFRDCTWLVTERNGDHIDRIATPHHVDDQGAFRSGLISGDEPAGPGFVAYRTVPVTRKNLAVGALVFVVQNSRGPVVDAGGLRPSGAGGQPASSWDESPYGSLFWTLGIVESIEWERGFVRLEAKPDPFYLSGTRLAVLRYADGGTIEKLVDARAPAVADVIAPGRKVTISDPWAQVGGDKQPLAVIDKVPLAAIRTPCTGKEDHCLRPWVWFVDDGGEIVVSRWTGKAFVYAEDAKRVIDKPGVAYRTRPATDAEIVPGKRVLLYYSPSKIESEAGAHGRRTWVIVEVASIDRLDRVMLVKGQATRYAFDNVRTLVVYWLAGETAAAVQ